MPKSTLTIKQEKFCQAYMLTGNKSEAYRQAYSTENMAADTIANKASKLSKQGHVRARLQELQAEAIDEYKFSRNDMLREYDENRVVARNEGQAAAMNQATTGKAKMLGYLDGDKDQPSVVNNTVALSNMELAQRIAFMLTSEAQKAVDEKTIDADPVKLKPSE